MQSDAVLARMTRFWRPDDAVLACGGFGYDLQLSRWPANHWLCCWAGSSVRF
jgi:hypothetical protein